jgi:DNA-binding HxlR family transcriptional regulator
MYQMPKDLSQATPNVFNAKCPARFLLSTLTGKWNLLVVDALTEGRWRNGELLRKIEGISQKMLTQTLRSLEDLNIVKRIDMETVPPHVEYELTPIGQELREKICSFDRWVEENMLELIEDSESLEIEYI